MADDRRSGRRWADFPLAMAMLLPSAVILGVFVVYPLGRAMWLGQQRCDNFGDNCVSNGFDQYVDLFRSIEFQNALGVTFRFALITVPLGVLAGVGLAVLADKYLRGIGAFRTVFSSTVATSVAVASLMWLFLLQPSVGALANMEWFSTIFPSVKDPGWLQDPDTALFAVGMSNVWKNLGFTFILVTAGLQSIPRDLHEAAAVDGAGGIRRFWSITVPMLGPTLLFVVVVAIDRRVPGLRRDRPPHRWGPAAGEPHHDDPVLHLRTELTDPQRRRPAGRRGGPAVRPAARPVRAPARGHRTTGALWRLTSPPRDSNPPTASSGGERRPWPAQCGS